MENIIIAGRTLEELKQIQKEVRKDANKYIAQFIEAGESAVKEILELVEVDDERDEEAEGVEDVSEKVTALAAVAEKNLAQAKLISDISGVSYYLPFSEEWSNDGYYCQLEQRYEGLPDNKAVDALFSIIDSMESESRNWHSSRC
jgi:methyl-accepting chemotaxis protein